MYKKLTMKSLAAFAVAMFFSFSLSAQILTDYVEGGSGGATLEQIDSVTVGTQHQYIAEPDPYYNPGWAAATNTGLTATSTWSWFQAYNASGTATLPAAGSATTNTNDNTITITFGATAGLDSIGVYEGSTTSTVCDGDTSYLKIAVIASPTVDWDATTLYGGATAGTLEVCEGDAQLASLASVTFTESVLGNPFIYLDYSFTIDTVSSDATVSPVTSFDSITSAGDQVVDINTATYNLYRPSAADGYADDYACLADASSGRKAQTVYTYTLKGVSDRISRKGDYSTGGYTSTKSVWTLYDTTDDIFTIIVNPAPVTGPIYHISNTWAK